MAKVDPAKQLNEGVECSKCWKSAKVPLKLCAAGHVLCCECVKSLESCPCKASITSDNTILIKNLLDPLPRLLDAFPRLCRHSQHGCKQVVKVGDDHETICGFRLVTCRICVNFSVDKSSVKKPISQLVKHHKGDHLNSMLVVKDEIQLVLPNFDPNKVRRSAILVFLFDNLFWVSKDNDIKEKQLKMSFQMLPNNNRLVDDYYVRVEFKKDFFVYSYTMKATCNDDEKDDYGFDQLDHCMRVPQDMLKHFVNDQGFLEHTLYFSKVAKKM